MADSSIVEETFVPGRPLSASPGVVLRRAMPFIVASLLVLSVALVGPGHLSLGDIAPALALEFVLVGVILVFPLFGDPPAWVQALPPMAYFGVVYLADTASVGPRRAMVVLGFLPVIWFALYGTRRQLWLGIGGLAAVAAAPTALIGGPDFPGEDWHRAWTVVAVGGLVGWVVQRLVEAQRDATRRERETLNDVRTVTDAVREISGDAREQLCAVACDVSGAMAAAIAEVGEDRLLRITGQHGLPALLELPPIPIVPDSVTETVVARSERVFIPDHREEEHVRVRFPFMDELASILWEPILRDGETIGLLLVGWRENLGSMADRNVALIGLLAAEAAGVLERGDLHDRLEHQSRTDALTGLPNRRAWDDFIARECAVADRTGAPLCVAMIDLDRFKAFNDEHGHQAGDELLERAARAWGGALRSIDLLARIGGEEFVLGLPGCDVDDARGIVERLRALTPDEQTCSAGIAARAGGEPIATLLGRADGALYQAKADGRACSRVAA